VRQSKHARKTRPAPETNQPRRSPVRRLIRGLALGVGAVAYLYASTSLLLFHGPYTALKSFFIQSLDTTMHGYLLKPLSLWTLSQQEIDKYKPEQTISGPAVMPKVKDYSKLDSTKITFKVIHEPTFTAHVMFVANPNRVKVAVTKYLDVRGQTVSEFVRTTGAIAGINGGAFEDANHWRGTGGIPLGITMHDGKLIHNDPSQWYHYPEIGITAKGQLVVGAYTLAQLKKLDVKECLSFGPVLIQNGVPVHGINTWGYAPRTAIGQEANGTMVLVVTDGRLVNGVNDVGASIAELRQLMEKLGCVNAANLDGGSSTTMVYKGKLLDTPTDVLGERAVATAVVVMP
jgi:exopolysaccharide biosynthesis protein